MFVKSKKRITIKDVAKLSGMSYSTVSRVLNGFHGFPDSTRKKVWDAANELKYTPNSQARGLRAGSETSNEKTGIIIHITHLGEDSPDGSKYEALRSLKLAWNAEKIGLYPISYWYHKRKGFQCPPVLNGHVDGAIVGTLHMEVVEILKDKIPMVLMDVPFTARAVNVPMVNTNLQLGFCELMTELKRLGHKSFGCFYSPVTGDGTSLEAPVASAISSSAKITGLQLSDELWIAENICPDTHDSVMKKVSNHFIKLIKKGELSVVILANMVYAKSIYENLTEAGLKIPEDVSIAALDTGLEPVPYNITAVKYDWDGLIRTSLDILKSLIDKRTYQCTEFLVNPIFEYGSTISNSNIK